MPGDLRQQFYSVIDRSNLGLDPTAVPWAPTTPYPAGQLVLNGPYAYRSLNAGISGPLLPLPAVSGPTGTGTAILDGTIVWGISRALQPQPYSAALDIATSGAAPGQLMPIVAATAPPNIYLPVAPGGSISVPGSYNVYLSNVINSATGTAFPTGTPYAPAVNTYQAVVYADGKPVTLQFGSFITIGVGANREPTPFRVNYVNNDGSLNVGDPTNMLGAGSQPFPTLVHAPGELVSNYTLGNPGIEPLFDYRNAFYSAVVPYARRVK